MDRNPFPQGALPAVVVALLALAWLLGQVGFLVVRAAQLPPFEAASACFDLDACRRANRLAAAWFAAYETRWWTLAGALGVAGLHFWRGERLRARAASWAGPLACLAGASILFAGHFAGHALRYDVSPSGWSASPMPAALGGALVLVGRLALVGGLVALAYAATSGESR